MAKKLLLADDSQTIHRVLELTFAEEEFEIISAFNGDEAIEKLKESKPDLVIADVNMPEKDGYQVCQYIKDNPDFSNIPVILLKGTFEPFDETKATACHYDGIIAKPFQTKNIINTVKEILGTAQPSEETPILEVGIPEETPADVLPPKTTVQPKSPEPAVEPEEIVIHEEPGLVMEKTAAPIDESAAAVVEKSPDKAEDEVPELESLTEEEILGLGESSGEEIILEDISAPKEDDETMSVSLEQKTMEKKEETIPIEEEPVIAEKALISEEPAGTEPIELTKEEILAERKALGIEDKTLEEQKSSISAEGGGIPPKAGESKYNDELIEQITKRVVNKLSNKTIEEIAWEVIPDMAERIIKKAIDDIKKS